MQAQKIQAKLSQTAKANSIQSESGVVFLEMALSIAIFVALTILTTDVLRMSYETANAQFIVNTAIRDAALNMDPDTLYTADPVVADPQSMIDRTDDVEEIVRRVANRYGVLTDATRPDGTEGFSIEICSMRELNCATAGGPGELISIRISYPFGFIFWAFQTRIEAVAVARNEPFVLLDS